MVQIQVLGLNIIINFCSRHFDKNKCLVFDLINVFAFNEVWGVECLTYCNTVLFAKNMPVLVGSEL